MFTLLNYCMVKGFDYFPQGDAADHVIKSVLAWRNLLSGQFSAFSWGDAFYPPLLYQTTALFYLIFPPGVESAMLSQWGILIFSLYGLGKLLFSKTTGFLAVFFFLSCPLTLLWSYQYMLDLPAAAFTVLSFYLLLRSQDFTDSLYSRLFGLSLGLGMLLKWWVGYLLAGVLVYYFCRLYLGYFKSRLWRVAGLLLIAGLFWAYWRAALHFSPSPEYTDNAAFWRFCGFSLLMGGLMWGIIYGFIRLAPLEQAASGKQKALLNYLAALSLALLLCGWLYFNPNFALLNGKLFEYVLFTVPTPWPGLDYYPLALWENALRLPYLVFLLVGFAAIFFTKPREGKKPVWLLALVTAFLLLVLPVNKQERYLLPWLALAAPGRPDSRVLDGKAEKVEMAGVGGFLQPGIALLFRRPAGGASGLPGQSAFEPGHPGQPALVEPDRPDPSGPGFLRPAFAATSISG